LGVTDIDEDGALVAQIFGTGKNAGVLGLSGRGANDRNSSRVHRDGGIIKIRHPGDAEVVEGAGDGAGLRAREVGSVRGGFEDHIGGFEDFATGTVGGCKLEQALHGFHDGQGGGGLETG